MKSTLVELRASPPFERLHVQGVLALVSIPHEVGTPGPVIRARRYQALDWMENALETELQNAIPHAVNWERAQGLLGRVTGVSVPVISSSVIGIHETAYRLRVWSGAGGCEFNWWHELPQEWLALSEIVLEVEAMAREVLDAA